MALAASWGAAARLPAAAVDARPRGRAALSRRPLPHSRRRSQLCELLGLGALNVGLFVVYHPLAARLWDRRQPAVFDDPRFLLQCALLGSACVLAYGFSGSLWAPVLIHWLAVAAWLGPLRAIAARLAPSRTNRRHLDLWPMAPMGPDQSNAPGRNRRMKSVRATRVQRGCQSLLPGSRRQHCTCNCTCTSAVVLATRATR